jgi:hypothetical protein
LLVRATAPDETVAVHAGPLSTATVTVPPLLLALLPAPLLLAPLLVPVPLLPVPLLPVAPLLPAVPLPLPVPLLATVPLLLAAPLVDAPVSSPPNPPLPGPAPPRL